MAPTLRLSQGSRSGLLCLGLLTVSAALAGCPPTQPKVPPPAPALTKGTPYDDVVVALQTGPPERRLQAAELLVAAHGA